jgi:S1-C subfamily serine protease
MLLLTLVANMAGLGVGVAPTCAADLDAIVSDLWRDIPHRSLERPIAPPPASPQPFILRGPPSAGVVIYEQRVNGVVVVATRDKIGSGSLISPHGDIITAEHVVQNAHHAEGAQWVLVWFKPASGAQPAKDQFLPARILYRDPVRDLVLLRLARPLPMNSTVIPLGKGFPKIGQEVFSIGHPDSYFWTFTQGVVSQIRPNHSWLYSDGSPRVATVIQVQTPANPGSSGSPLLDRNGAMIGVIVGVAPGAHGLYFAVSTQHVQDLLVEK